MKEQWKTEPVVIPADVWDVIEDALEGYINNNSVCLCIDCQTAVQQGERALGWLRKIGLEGFAQGAGDGVQ